MAPANDFLLRDSLRQLDSDTLLWGNSTLISRQKSPSLHSWSDGNGSYFVLSKSPWPVPFEQTKPVSPAAGVQLVYDVANKSAVWKVGEAFLKAHLMDFQTTTREHVTLEFVHSKNPTTFRAPDVIYHDEHEGAYYIILSALNGDTIEKAWPSMKEDQKERAVTQLVTACLQMAEWEGDQVAGVDGSCLEDEYLSQDQSLDDLGPQGLLKHCQELGMDCSSFQFFHCDMGPGNIIINRDGSLGIIDWGSAGYVPKEWIRTKFRVSSGLDLQSEDEGSDPHDWRRRVQIKLGEHGMPDVVGKWTEWFSS